jgi:hypothetical protein
MAIAKWRSGLIASVATITAACAVMMPGCGNAAGDTRLWSVYEQSIKGAKYVDLTHTITPHIPVWAGFAESTFAAAQGGPHNEGICTQEVG